MAHWPSVTASTATRNALTGAAENLVIADKQEAWVLHVLPDDTGASAIWAAARVPEGHAAAVTNMFVIRNVELDNPRNFRYSASMLEVAARLHLKQDEINLGSIAVFYSVDRGLRHGCRESHIWCAVKLSL